MNISRKFTLWIISIVFVIGFLSAYLYRSSEMYNEEIRIESLANTVGPILEQGLADYMLTRDSDALSRTLDNLKSIRPINRIRLLNKHGVIKASSNEKEAGTVLSPDDPECRGCHEKGLRGLSIKSEGTFRWAQPVRNKPECHRCHNPSERLNGVFIIDFSLGELTKHIQKNILRGFLILLLSLVLIGSATIVLSKTLVIKRLYGVMDKVKRFKEGDYNAYIPVEGNDEITRLGKTFNEMAAEINTRDREKDILYKQVSRSYEQWQHTFDSITELISIIDMEGNIVRANRTFMEHFGVTQEDLREKKCFDLFYGENVPDKSFPDKAKDIHYTEEKIVDKDGRTFSVSTFPYAYPEADFHGSILVAWDITERKRLEGEREKLILELQNILAVVSRSQKEWQDTFDSITDLISIQDKDFNIIRANKAMAASFGLHPREVVGKKCYELYHGSDSPVAWCPNKITLEEGKPVTREVLTPATNRTFRVSTFPYYSPGGKELIGSIHIARDITEEKEKGMRLIMSERLASLGQMASGIAHEINNPLASIAGCAEGLLNRVKKGHYDPELFENYLNIIEEEISRCKGITTGILSFARRTTHEKKELQINGILDKTLEIIGFQGRLREVEIIKNYKSEMPVIKGNEGELRQVFMIIITNALDAMEDKGTLKIETGAEEEILFIKISDTGPGIPLEHINRIFDPFFTTKSEKGGTGLGLSIARKIIVNHNGNIDAFSKEGKGMTFKITLPI